MGDLLKYDEHGNLISVNLDLKNPTDLKTIVYEDPEFYLKNVYENQKQINALLEEVDEIIKGRSDEL